MLGITPTIALIDPVLAQDQNAVDMPKDSYADVGTEDGKVGHFALEARLVVVAFVIWVFVTVQDLVSKCGQSASLEEVLSDVAKELPEVEFPS